VSCLTLPAMLSNLDGLAEPSDLSPGTRHLQLTFKMCEEDF